MSLKVDRKDNKVSHRAIIFIDDVSDDTVFLHDSVSGVRRIFINQYMELIEAPHDGQYSLKRTTLKEFGINNLAIADAEYMQKTVTAIDIPCKTDKVILAFRSVWYAMTGEVMEI